MNWPADASDWMDVVDHLIVILGAIILAGVPTWFAARNHGSIKAGNATLTAIKDQVVNGHEQPMRADLDRVISEVGKVTAAVDHMSQVVSSIREDAADERSTRRTEIRELREDVDARLTALNRRIP